LASQSSNATTIKMTGTNIRSPDASNQKTANTKQRNFLVYLQDESSFSEPLQSSLTLRESPQVAKFGGADLENQQFSFDAKSFSSENCRTTLRLLASFALKAALSYKFFGQWNPILGLESCRGSSMPSDAWYSDGEEEAEEKITGKELINDYFNLWFKNQKGKIMIYTLLKDELQDYQGNTSSPLFYNLSLSHLLGTVHGQLLANRDHLGLNPNLNPAELFYSIKIPRKTKGRLDFRACPRPDVKNWHEILTNMTRNNNWLLEIYRRHAPKFGDDGYEACQKCKDLRALKREFPMLVDMEKAVCN
jgi:hypothetical protein